MMTRGLASPGGLNGGDIESSGCGPKRRTNLARAPRAGPDRRRAQRGRAGDGRADPPLPRIRPAQGELVLPRRRRRQRPRPGGPGRALQGGARLPLRQGDLVPLVRRALHHPPDHHGDQDRDPVQARAAQHLRLVQPYAGRPGSRRRLHARATRSRARPSTTRRRASSPPTSSRACSSALARPCRRSSPRCSPSTWRDAATRRSAI